MEENLYVFFDKNPELLFAGILLFVAAIVYLVKKLKNLIILLMVLFCLVGYYLLKNDYIDPNTIGQLKNAKTVEEYKKVYHDFLQKKSAEMKQKAKDAIIETIKKEL